MNDWGVVHYVSLGLVMLLFTYTVVRIGSFAYFRTKLEYLRSVLKELNGGRRNGQGE